MVELLGTAFNRDVTAVAPSKKNGGLAGAGIVLWGFPSPGKCAHAVHTNPA